MVLQIAADAEGDSGGLGSGEKEVNAGQKVVTSLRVLLSPYNTLMLARRMALLFVLWFSASLVYYGVSLNATNIR